MVGPVPCHHRIPGASGSAATVFLLWPERHCSWANHGFWNILLGWPRAASRVTGSCFWESAPPHRSAPGPARGPAHHFPLLPCIVVPAPPCLPHSHACPLPLPAGTLCPLLDQPPSRGCGWQPGSWVLSQGLPGRGSRGWLQASETEWCQTGQHQGLPSSGWLGSEGALCPSQGLLYHSEVRLLWGRDTWARGRGAGA